jgi:hypothetical protein
MDQQLVKTVRRKAFKREEIPKLIEAARRLPKKADTKEDLNIQELIPRIWPALGALLGKGYNYEDVAEFLINNGVEASPETLKSAIGDEARKRKRKGSSYSSHSHGNTTSHSNEETEPGPRQKTTSQPNAHRPSPGSPVSPQSRTSQHSPSSAGFEIEV